jgi:hypothetical protein
MKNILFILFVFLSAEAFGQFKNQTGVKLYAIRKNINESVDSFYVKVFRMDSIFNSSGNSVAATVEYYQQFVEPEIPEGFGNFFKCADGLYRNIYLLAGIKTYTVVINANAASNLTLSSHTNSEQPLDNSQRGSVRVNTSGFLEARLTGVVMSASASANSPRLYFQYSTDAVSWSGGGSGISLSTTGAKETSWVALTAEAKGDIYIRVAQNGGDGVASPALGNITIQFR